MAVAGVRTVKGVDLWFDAVTQVCTTFSHCRAWANLNRVMWRAVPSATSIWYYSDDNCQSKIVYTTNPSLSSGTAVLSSNPAGVQIKSLMAIGTSPDPTKGEISECYYDLDDYNNERTVVLLEIKNSSTTGNVPDNDSNVTFSEDMSKNWLGPLLGSKTLPN